MAGKLAPNSSHLHLTRGLVKYVPGRGDFRAVSSQNGDKFVTSPPPPPIVERVFERDERGAQVVRKRNGGGCDRPRPFSVIAIWAGIVLAKCHGGTVTSAQFSIGIGIMHLCWGL